MPRLGEELCYSLGIPNGREQTGYAEEQLSDIKLMCMLCNSMNTKLIIVGKKD